MTGLGFLDLVIGLIFIYFILSQAVSILQEIRANLFKLRSKNLEKWVKDTFAQDGLGEELLNHELITGLVRNGRKPSYIPSENFVNALLDIINKNSEGDDPTYDIESIKKSIEQSSLPEGLKRYVLQKISEANGELDKVKNAVASWFDSCMDRLGGTYKNIHQWWLIGSAFIVVAFFNADTIALAKFLYTNQEARAAIIEAASSSTVDSLNVEVQNLQHATTADTAGTNIADNTSQGVHDLEEIEKQLSSLELPLGWANEPLLQPGDDADEEKKGIGWLTKIVGLLITTLAVSVGAPFWFDMLNKLVNLKGAGATPASQSQTT